MSKQKKAKLARRMLRAQAARALPLKVVPSKKGLLTAWLICASAGFASGILLERVIHMVRNHG